MHRTFDVEMPDYCKDCPEFEPRINNEQIYANGDVYMSSIIIWCTHNEKCQHLMKHLGGVINNI